jgi:hypothetical protein
MRDVDTVLTYPAQVMPFENWQARARRLVEYVASRRAGKTRNEIRGGRTISHRPATDFVYVVLASKPQSAVDITNPTPCPATVEIRRGSRND